VDTTKGENMATEEEKKAQTMRLRGMREALGYKEQKDFANALVRNFRCSITFRASE
jgi:hypothetical protein